MEPHPGFAQRTRLNCCYSEPPFRSFVTDETDVTNSAAA